jgi:ketosteroid isomerase-like protein
MPEEPTTPDLVALGLQAYEALSCGDFDAVMSLFAADAVYDGSDAGIGTFEGAEAIRGFIEDWFRSWEEYQYEAEEIRDLGHGVVVFVLREGGRLIGGNGRVEQRGAHVTTWAERTHRAGDGVPRHRQGPRSCRTARPGTGVEVSQQSSCRLGRHPRRMK